MYQPRKVESDPSWQDPDGIKIYTISAKNTAVEQADYIPRLKQIKKEKPLAWASVPAFAIFHDGDPYPYLVLAWWGNGNELFTSVSVNTDSVWIEDSAQYSFCLWDMEVMWGERNLFIEHIYSATPDLKRYRAARVENL